MNEETEEQATDDHDEIFAALNVTVGIQKTLDELNRKLGKLDNIQKAVNVVKDYPQKLEVRIQSIESLKRRT